MFKKLLSLLLVIGLLASVSVIGASAEEGVASDGEYYTYYVMCPADWFTTNDSIGLYYWVPEQNAAWPGVEVPEENCVYKLDDGQRVFKVQVWQENEDTKDEFLTTPTILFNSFVDASIDPVNGHQIDNINMEGYLKGDEIPYGKDTKIFPRYSADFETLNFNNMIFIPNPENMVENEFSHATAIKDGVWYYYWGDGEYGVTKTKPVAGGLGDVNGDGNVSMEDVTTMQKGIAKLVNFTDAQTTSADVTKDGNVTMEDVTTTQKFIAHLITEF